MTTSLPDFSSIFAPCSLRKSNRRVSQATHTACKALLGYLVAGAVWILFSDHALFALSFDAATTATLGIYKGWLFVVVTGALMFWQLRAKLAIAGENEEKLRLALEGAHVGTWSLEAASGRIACDEALASLWGRARADFARGGLDFFSACLHPADRASVENAIAASLRDGTEFAAEYRVVRPDGEVLWFTGRASVERDATGRPARMIGACADVTQVRRIERALHESEVRFREVVETIREIFWIKDVETGRVLYVSPRYEEIWGRKREELYADENAWLKSIDPQDRDRVRQAALDRQESGLYDETYRIARPDGGMRWIRDRAYPVRDDAGSAVRIVGAAEDITDRKKLEEQFLHAQRLEAIGSLASGVAHDLNNILAPIIMIGPMLRENLSDPKDARLLAMIELSAQRGANVIRQLLTFSRGLAGERGPLQLRHLVKEMVAIMRETFPREIGIADQMPDGLPPVLGDVTQLHQVLMNLCVNARDAMPDGGKLSLSGREVMLGADALYGQGNAIPGRYVVLTVADTGLGIPPPIRARIFEPFFTTKEIGKGTGLGLSTVLGIVKSHGGFVTLDSEVGKGTSFHIHLPVAETMEKVSLPDPTQGGVGRGALVLVVDDEATVRTAMKLVLERNGYRVLTAGNGRQGLGLFRKVRKQVRAVITDIMMPDVNGIGLIQALREISPRLPIFAATGLEGGDQRDDLRLLGVARVLSKPYAPGELLKALEWGLADPQAAAA